MRFSVVLKLMLPIAILVSSNCIASENIMPEWSYDDDYTGQDDWGAINDYRVCRDGMSQSPVNISYTKTSKLPLLNFKYSKADGIMKVTKQSFVMEVNSGGTIIDGEEPYTLKSVEIHSPSGHRIRENVYPAEIHLIHKNPQNELLIIAIFANIGNANPAVDIMLKEANSRSTNKFSADTSSLVSTTSAYYAYNGSLPYPPCTENVKWRILKKTISISQEQLAKIGRYIGRNTRLPQPVYIREILETNQ